MGKNHQYLLGWKLLFSPIIFFLLLTPAVAADDDDIIDFLPTILSATKNKPTPPSPSIDYTGVWTIHEIATSPIEECSYQSDFKATVIKNADETYSVDFGHKTVKGSIINEQLIVHFEGSYEEAGGQTNSVFNGTFTYKTPDGYSFTGNETWSWSDGEYSCAGQSTFTGTKDNT